MRINDNVFSLDCTKSGRCYCVRESDGYTLIDTGMPRKTKEILEELATYNIQPSQIKRILLTHGDVDHIGNVNAIRKITGCKVYADAAEIPYLEKRKRYNAIKGFLKILLRIGKILDVTPLPQHKIGEIEIFKTPGHTPGHVCFKLNNIIFAGDLVGESEGQIRIMSDKMTFNKQQLINSIKTLNVTGVDLLCLAHGSDIKVNPT
jgi:glyoxylase-like metal-dependent hydrolase (beta-lactamase superfamily II)